MSATTLTGALFFSLSRRTPSDICSYHNLGPTGFVDMQEGCGHARTFANPSFTPRFLAEIQLPAMMPRNGQRRFSGRRASNPDARITAPERANAALEREKGALELEKRALKHENATLKRYLQDALDDCKSKDERIEELEHALERATGQPVTTLAPSNLSKRRSWVIIAWEEKQKELAEQAEAAASSFRAHRNVTGFKLMPYMEETFYYYAHMLRDKNTLASMNNLGVLLDNMKDYEGALGYYQQALRVGEKVQGKTHPDTLGTIMNMAITYEEGLKDFKKAEVMYRQALDGHEKSLGNQHEYTKDCAMNLSILYFQGAPSKEKLRELVTDYPYLLTLEDQNIGMIIRDFLRS